MFTRIKLLTTAFLFLSAMAGWGDTATFETTDYSSLGSWDSWEASPFRTGTLDGTQNVKVIDNPVTDGNSSSKVLAFLRSRHGSNTFGAKIDLKEADRFELTTTTKYVHAQIYKQTSGRVMCILLGRRDDNALHSVAFTDGSTQATTTEQAWVLSSTTVTAGKWCDAVFPVTGHGGDNIYSIVIVPECESTDAMTSDEVVYIDNVHVNSNASAETISGTTTTNYATTVSTTDAMTRTDRYTAEVSLTGGNDGTQTVTTTQKTDKLIYQNCLSQTLLAKAGEKLTADFSSANNSIIWMHRYVYIDYGNDGQFDYDGWEGKVTTSSFSQPSEQSDLVAFSYYTNATSNIDSASGYNSIGTSCTGKTGVANPPAFTIPSTLAEGFYRMRFKVDWCSIDPSAATQVGTNNITTNGGSIIDVRLNIHGDKAHLTSSSYNGNVQYNGTNLTTESTDVTFGAATTIHIEPAASFECKKITVRHGHNLSGSQYDTYGNKQWDEVSYSASEFDSDNNFTLPAEVVDGDVDIVGTFDQKGSTDGSTVDINSGVYAIYDTQYGLYWNLETLDSNSCITNQLAPTPVKFTEGATSGTWYIQSANTNEYVSISSAKYWNVVLTTEETTAWGIQASEDITDTNKTGSGAYVITNPTNSNYHPCAQASSAGSTVYSNTGTGNNNNFTNFSTFDFIPMYLVTYNFVDENGNVLESSATYVLKDGAYPTATAPNGYTVSTALPTTKVTGTSTITLTCTASTTTPTEGAKDDADVSPGVNVYRIPTGTASPSAKLSGLTITGNGVTIVNEVKATMMGCKTTTGGYDASTHYGSFTFDDYAADTKMTSTVYAPAIQSPLWYTIYACPTARVYVARGGTINLSGTLTGYGNTNLKVKVWYDFDGDCVFEGSITTTKQAAWTASIPVPSDAATKGRLRIRVDLNGDSEANATLSGHCYDIPVRIEGSVVNVGDVDEDGNYDLDDVERLKGILLGTAAESPNQDVNADGHTAIGDQAKLIQILLNQK